MTRITDGAPAARDEAEARRGNAIARWGSRLIMAGPALVAIVLVVLVVVFGLLSPELRFLAPGNLLAVASNAASLLLLSVGVTYVLGAGHLDLSVGMNLVLSSVVSAKVIVHLAGTPEQVAAGIYPNEATAIFWGIVAGIAAGTAFGALNGLIVTRMKVNSFVATLGTTGVATGLFNIITNGSNVNFLPTSLQADFGYETFLGIPGPLILAVVVAAIGGVVLAKTVFGRHVHAVGSSAVAAEKSGVSSSRVTMKVFLIAGSLAGIAGVLDLAKFGTTALAGHGTDVMQALSAVIIGGTSLYGGVTSMFGTAMAAILLTVLTSGFVVIGVPPFYQYIAVGVILVLAVYLDNVRRRSSPDR